MLLLAIKLVNSAKVLDLVLVHTQLALESLDLHLTSLKLCLDQLLLDLILFLASLVRDIMLVNLVMQSYNLFSLVLDLLDQLLLLYPLRHHRALIQLAQLLKILVLGRYIL